MENSKVNLLRSELNMATSYIDRLFHGLFDLSDLDYHPEIKKIILPFERELYQILNKEIFRGESILFFEYAHSPNCFRDWISNVFTLLENLSRLGIHENLQTPLIDFINCSYRLGRELHLFSLRETDLVVELPRTIITTEVQQNKKDLGLSLQEFITLDDDDQEIDDWTDETLPLYQIDLDLLENSPYGGSILSFSMGALKKSKDLINKGHECVFEKKYSNALVFFEKSRRLHETAEVLTLIGWVYSLLDNLEKAKKFCLKAIEIDPDYGPAYNDIGSYLLQEGDIHESIRWFNLAKNAPIYQNKEYPFINLGRAYLMQKKYRQALSEFIEAKNLAPHQRQINDTILKIEKLMESNEEFAEMDSVTPIFRRTENQSNIFEPEFQ